MSDEHLNDEILPTPTNTHHDQRDHQSLKRELFYQQNVYSESDIDMNDDYDDTNLSDITDYDDDNLKNDTDENMNISKINNYYTSLTTWQHIILIITIIYSLMLSSIPTASFLLIKLVANFNPIYASTSTQVLYSTFSISCHQLTILLVPLLYFYNRTKSVAFCLFLLIPLYILLSWSLFLFPEELLTLTEGNHDHDDIFSNLSLFPLRVKVLTLLSFICSISLQCAISIISGGIIMYLISYLLHYIQHFTKNYLTTPTIHSLDDISQQGPITFYKSKALSVLLTFLAILSLSFTVVILSLYYQFFIEKYLLWVAVLLIGAVGASFNLLLLIYLTIISHIPMLTNNYQDNHSILQFNRKYDRLISKLNSKTELLRRNDENFSNYVRVMNYCRHTFQKIKLKMSYALNNMVMFDDNTLHTQPQHHEQYNNHESTINMYKKSSYLHFLSFIITLPSSTKNQKHINEDNLQTYNKSIVNSVLTTPISLLKGENNIDDINTPGSGVKETNYSIFRFYKYSRTITFLYMVTFALITTGSLLFINTFSQTVPLFFPTNVVKSITNFRKSVPKSDSIHRDILQNPSSPSQMDVGQRFVDLKMKYNINELINSTNTVNHTNIKSPIGDVDIMSMTNTTDHPQMGNTIEKPHQFELIHYEPPIPAQIIPSSELPEYLEDLLAERHALAEKLQDEKDEINSTVSPQTNTTSTQPNNQLQYNNNDINFDPNQNIFEQHETLFSSVMIVVEGHIVNQWLVLLSFSMAFGSCCSALLQYYLITYGMRKINSAADGDASNNTKNFNNHSADTCETKQNFIEHIQNRKIKQIHQRRQNIDIYQSNPDDVTIVNYDQPSSLYPKQRKPGEDNLCLDDKQITVNDELDLSDETSSPQEISYDTSTNILKNSKTTTYMYSTPQCDYRSFNLLPTPSSSSNGQMASPIPSSVIYDFNYEYDPFDSDTDLINNNNFAKFSNRVPKRQHSDNLIDQKDMFDDCCYCKQDDCDDDSDNGEAVSLKESFNGDRCSNHHSFDNPMNNFKNTNDNIHITPKLIPISRKNNNIVSFYRIINGHITKLILVLLALTTVTAVFSVLYRSTIPILYEYNALYHQTNQILPSMAMNGFSMDRPQHSGTVEEYQKQYQLTSTLASIPKSTEVIQMNVLRQNISNVIIDNINNTDIAKQKRQFFTPKESDIDKIIANKSQSNSSSSSSSPSLLPSSTIATLENFPRISPHSIIFAKTIFVITTILVGMLYTSSGAIFPIILEIFIKPSIFLTILVWVQLCSVLTSITVPLLLHINYSIHNSTPAKQHKIPPAISSTTGPPLIGLHAQEYHHDTNTISYISNLSLIMIVMFITSALFLFALRYYHVHQNAQHIKFTKLELKYSNSDENDSPSHDVNSI